MQNFKHLGDEECAALAQRGDRAAFSELVVRYQDRIYRFLVRLTRSPDEAIELTQDAFLNAYQALEHWQRETHFSAWLFRVARNRAFDWLRRHGHEVPARRLLGVMLEVPLDGGRYRSLEAALARLPPEHREILLLREIEDMPYQDIATVLGLNVGTVKSRIARARTALLEKMPHRPEVPK